jgi:hypothetical protein
MSHSQTSGWTRMPRVSGSGCPRDSVNLLWDGLPGDRKSRETGVGKNEHSPADMRRTKVASRELSSGTVEASSRQIARDFGFPLRVSRRLLHDKPFCSGVEPDAEHVGPQGIPGSPSMDRSTNARALAGRTTDDEIAPNALKSPHVVMHRDAGKVATEQPAPSRLDLDKLDGAEAANGVEAEGVPADVAEEVEDIHGSGFQSFCQHCDWVISQSP